MGQIRFLVPDPRRLAAPGAETAYMTGIDGAVWRSNNRFGDGELRIERAESDSGKLYVLWHVDGYGLMTLSTSSLAERSRPYHLAVELARGTIHRIRNQIGEWTDAGLRVPETASERLRDAHQALARAAIAQSNASEAEALAEQSLQSALQAGELIATTYARQSLAVRHKQMARLATLFGVRLGPSDPNGQVAELLRSAFNTAAVSLGWREAEAREGKYDWSAADRQIAWCRKHGLKICGGPLLTLDTAGVPDWLYLWEGDLDHVFKFARNYIEATVQRYVGKVNLWHAAARANIGRAAGLAEDQALRLTAHAVEAIRAIDERAPVIVSFDQPWSEYMGRDEHDLSGLHMADALVRAQLGLSGVALELNLGYWPGGTLPRDPLEVSRQVDRYSALGLPLVILLTAPSSAAADPKTRGRINPVASVASSPTLQTQLRWVERLVPLLLAKPTVQGVFWNQLADDPPCELPHGGLVDTDGAVKPAFGKLAEIRREHLA